MAAFNKNHPIIAVCAVAVARGALSDHGCFPHAEWCHTVYRAITVPKAAGVPNEQIVQPAPSPLSLRSISSTCLENVGTLLVHAHETSSI